MSKQIAYIAMGSNLGDRPATLLEAAKMLAALDGVRVLKISGMIKTEAVGGPEDQPKYLNAAVEVETTLAPRELLAALHGIETALGRDRQGEDRWGERTCDLDILLMGEITMDSPDLTIPHPRMHERLFVLRPLAEIAPSAVHPKLGLTVAEMFAAADHVSHGRKPVEEGGNKQ